MVVVYFEILPQNLWGKTEENGKTPEFRYSTSGPKY
jgi:hypothetical protein